MRRCTSLPLAHRVMSLLRGNLVALGTKRKSDELRLQNQVMSTRPCLSPVEAGQELSSVQSGV